MRLWIRKAKRKRHEADAPSAATRSTISRVLGNKGKARSDSTPNEGRTADVLERLQTACSILSTVADAANVPFLKGAVSAASGLLEVAQVCLSYYLKACVCPHNGYHRR